MAPLRHALLSCLVMLALACSPQGTSFRGSSPYSGQAWAQAPVASPPPASPSPAPASTSALTPTLPLPASSASPGANPTSPGSASPEASSSSTANQNKSVEEIIGEMMKRVGALQGAVECKVQITRLDPHFMEPFLPPVTASGVLPLKGSVSFALGHYDLALNAQDAVDTTREIKFSSDDGYTLRGEPYAAPSSAPSASPSVVPSGDPSASPSTSPSADPSASPSVAPSGDPSASPSASASSGASAGLYTLHPLTLLWNFQYKILPRTATFRFPQEGEGAREGTELIWDSNQGRNNEVKCWYVIYTSGTQSLKLAIDKSTYSVVKLEYKDPTDGQMVEGEYSAFAALNGGLFTYQSLKLRKNNQDLLQITVTEPPVFNKAIAPPPDAVPAGPTPQAHIFRQETITAEVVFTSGLIGIILILGVALSIYGGRYLLFLLLRTPFSRDLLLVEAPNGPLKPALEALGFKVELATMDLVSDERNYLGKKVGDRQARAVVIAPNAFHLVKSYLFLLRAYVEEGGRVFVLNHPPSAVSVMPFTPYFVAHTGEGKHLLIAKSGFWKRLRVEEVQTKTAHLLPKEYYVEINQRKFDVDILQTHNQATGVRAVGIGVLREGKGEYLVCQFALAEDLAKAKPSAIARLMMLDLLDFLQARPMETPKPPAA